MDEMHQDDNAAGPLKKSLCKCASGRTKRMVLWLQLNEERIESANKGKVTLDFAGQRVTARFEEVDENI